MQNIDQELIDWAKEKIVKKYPEDIALLIGQMGACKTPEDEQNIAFDYYVPLTDKGYLLAETFVIENMGYDLYPQSFERIEGIANLKEPNMIFTLDQGVILYAKDKTQEKRYQDLQKLLHKNLVDINKTYVIALEYLDTVMEIYTTMLFEEKMYKVRKAAGGIASYLLSAIALTNGTYVVNAYGNLPDEFTKFTHKPEAFTACYDRILSANDADTIKDCCKELIQMTRAYLLEVRCTTYVCNKVETPKLEADISYEDLADWYQEARYTFRKIEYFSKAKIAANCYSLGCYLQIEFDAIKDEFALKEMDLLGTFDRNDLAAFATRTNKLETYIRETIQKHDVEIKEFKDLPEFLAKDCK